MSATSAKAIILTGATRGLGRAMVDQFIEHGHTVHGCGRSSDAINALRNEYATPHRFDIVDIADDMQVQQWAEQVLERSGAPDLLINNAGVINPNANLWKLDADEFDRVIDINIKGTANVIRHIVPAMIERGSGVIVNFSSTWGRVTSPQVAPYCATKFAIEGLTSAMSQELPSGMAAIALNPGVIDTDMLRSCFGAGAAGYRSPEQWARRAVPFVLSLGPSHNGQSLDAPS